MVDADRTGNPVVAGPVVVEPGQRSAGSGVLAASEDPATAAVAIADRTDANPATDPDLSARLLHELGRTIPLPQQVTETP